MTVSYTHLDVYKRQRFDDANRDLTKTNLFVNRVMTCMMPTMMFVMNGVSVLIIWVGAGKVDAGVMQVGDLMAFIQYAMQILMAFLMISMMSIIPVSYTHRQYPVRLRSAQYL